MAASETQPAGDLFICTGGRDISTVVGWRTEENHDKPQSGQPVSGLGFEPGTSRIPSRSVSHSTITLGETIIFLNG
jgi:hypothetical protein